jgi:hypothetical protein
VNWSNKSSGVTPCWPIRFSTGIPSDRSTPERQDSNELLFLGKIEK